ncbi:hypothetical protein EOK75_14105 (plasmid) [Pseudorhodobacter turbinis]|uniref:Uncharacterized protein n=1 Tax=Pseudorhodobacter turbinis TaxID=2500533 RepID=A0A4P8EIG1_9RHOB|nr:hypothetical protein [Pseudorhodobacter turbinis]QCO56930.1 hypothetical protein EOK75_14105 [Pseudorhodobacter turbinis]
MSGPLINMRDARRIWVGPSEAQRLWVGAGASWSKPDAAGYSPKDLFLSADDGFWYDFTDGAAVFQDAARSSLAANGQEIYGIQDKSDNGHHGAVTGGPAPKWYASGYADFLGNNAQQFVSGFVNGPTSTMIVAYRSTASVSGVLCGSSAANPRWYVQQRGTATVRFGLGGANQEYTGNNHTVGNVAIMGYDPANTNGWRQLGRLNGVDHLRSTATTSIQNGDIHVGATSGSSLGYQCTAQLVHAICINRALTDAELGSLDSYLSAAMGL